MVVPRYPAPRSPEPPQRPRRTLLDHHLIVRSLAQRLVDDFKADPAAESKMVDAGAGQLVEVFVRRCPEIPRDDGPDLCMYWMLYLALDRELRRAFEVVYPS